MPTVILNKTVFEQLVGKKLPLEQLKDRISMLGTDLEKIEGNEIHVEVFPNRPDMLSEQGFARALSSFIGAKTGLRKYTVKSSGYKIMVDKSVSMRPYTACAIVKNLTFNDEKIRELMQIQEKLAVTHGRNRKKSAYGIYPLDRINFPVKYLALDPEKVQFHPLGFSEAMNAAQVPEVHPKGKAYAHLTAGWKKYPFFIDAKENVMCMLPFTNSHNSGKVDGQTKDVFIEATGIDLENVQIALNILVTALADMGGEIYSLEIVYPDRKITTPQLSPKLMLLDLNYINKLLGLELNEKKAKGYLEQMGYGYEKGNALIPAYRADILHPVDVAEDIAIAYGYEHFQEEIPNVSTIGKEDETEKFCRKVREMMIGLQLLEAKNYHLLRQEELQQKMNSNLKTIVLKNALGEHNTLRNAIIPSLLKTLTENQHHEYPQNIFEIGRTFQYDQSKETGVREAEVLAIALCHEKTDFTEIRQVVDVVAALLDLSVVIKETVHPSFIPGRIGNIYIQNQQVGFLGEIHPHVLEHWGITMPVVAAEIEIEKIMKNIML